MDKGHSELTEKIRQQYDSGLYPIVPLEKSPKSDRVWLYIHNLLTPYYLRSKKVKKATEIDILDAGCGNGYTSLLLAEANPMAKIVGIDISEESIKLAKQRLQQHGFKNVEFHNLPIENISNLGRKFDYINCDEVLYLLNDPVAGLRAMHSVLKPDGIIRTNLHSSLQRAYYYRAQKVFKTMGLMEGIPQQMEIDLVWEIMRALKDNVILKQHTWDRDYEAEKELIAVNHLLVGDKGYTIPEMFSALKAADLEFISMVNWRQWDLMDLFKEPDNLPVFLGLSLPEISTEERLHLFELLHPIHRLLDFWCGHPNQAQSFVPVDEWVLSDWQQAKVYLHPQLKTPDVKEELLRCIAQLNQFAISKQLPITGQEVLVDSTIAACLLPLWDEAQSMLSLVERWQILRPVHLVSLKPTTQEEAVEVVKQVLIKLEEIGYVLLET
ncbi:MAG TPA: SAM-dependent methyltransferase [Cyanobacteria bacterium UBA8543]|nr:SAM-dependent methyltransferase [Cyanobacteria bacterium UBA8543]